MNRSLTRRHDVLFADSIDVTRLANRAGSTPFFVYARAAIDARVCQLRAKLPASIQLHYSLKANPMPAVVHHLATRIDGFDVASGAELALALNAGMPPDQIGFAGPGKTREELRCAVASGVNVHIESLTQLHLVAALGWELGLRPNVTIRVNPDFQITHAGMRMGGERLSSASTPNRFRHYCKNWAHVTWHWRGFMSSGVRSACTQLPLSKHSGDVPVSSCSSHPICHCRPGT